MPTHADCWAVMIHGELDITTKGHLAEVAAILAPLGKGVHLDLSGVTFIDPSGWDGVTAAVESLNRAGVPARVVHPSEQVRRLQALLAESALVRAA